MLNRVSSSTALQAFSQLRMLDLLIPKIIDKLRDGKIAIRQAACKLIIENFAVISFLLIIFFNKKGFQTYKLDRTFSQSTQRQKLNPQRRSS
jgi:hypothetical protein